jgi:hypothetical protein
MARHFALAAHGFPFILALIVISGMSKTSTTKWMANAAFETLATEHPVCRNRWIPDDKWIDVINTNYFTPPSKEKEEELKFSRENMVRAVGSRWQNTMEDFTLTNQNGTFWQSCMVPCL